MKIRLLCHIGGQGVDVGCCRQSTLRCKAVALQLGDIVVMASQALLGAAAALKAAAPKKHKRSPKQGLKPPSSSPLAGLPADAVALAALMPDLVQSC